MACYNLSDFLQACKRKHNVIVWKSARDRAHSDFGIWGEEELLDFIGNNGLDNMILQNTRQWDKNPFDATTILIDAYEFECFHKFGYLAFMYVPITSKWNIKSFKESDNAPPLRFRVLSGGLLT